MIPKRRLSLLVLSILLIAVMLLVAACDKDKPTKPKNEFGVVAGTVYSPGKAVLPGATVKIGDLSTTTDAQGRFILSGVTTASRVLVDFSMADRTSTQKVVSVSKGFTTYVSTTLFQVFSATFSSQTPINIDSGINISIPEQAFKTAAGTAFTGSVRAEVRYFDPTLPECLDAFPGTFSGIQTDGTTTMFESYGFVSATFRNAENTDEILQLAQGKQAQLTAPIPYSLLPNAPNTMPLWYYDDETGHWREEGFATKIGDSYVGSVSHFSYWNFDDPVTIVDQATLSGKVMAADRGTPIAGAQVVATGVNYAGYTTAYTNDQGVFSISVKASATVKLQAFSGTSASMSTQSISTPAGGQNAEVADLMIQDRSFMIMGKMVNASGTPLSGYGQLSQINPPAGEMGLTTWLNMDEEGNFNASAQNYSNSTSFNVIFSVDTRGTLFSASIPFTVPQPGNIYDFGTVTMRPGGNITGRIKDNEGNFLSNTWFSFMQEGGSGEEGHLSAEVDANGNFIVVGPPNTTVSNVRAELWMNNNSYQSPLMNLSFPASGSTRSIGTITVSPVPTP